jgi:hypothetical protein
VLPEVVDHYARQKQTAAQATLAARRAWRKTLTGDLNASWVSFLRLTLPIVTAAQTRAAHDGAAWVSTALAAQDLPDNPISDVVPTALVGVASDGRDLEPLLYSAVTDTKSAIGAGFLLSAALNLGLSTLERIVQTQVQDAGRVATTIGVAVRPNIGTVRYVRLPACPRCVILAGRWYRWTQGFARHPRCDCVNVPTSSRASSGLISDPKAAFDSGEIRGMSKADVRAVTLGADLNQVVNASRGMKTAQVYGRALKITTEGTTKRGLAGQRLGDFDPSRTGRYRSSRTPRLMPESILKIAGDDREEAVRLLRRFGYIL